MKITQSKLLRVGTVILFLALTANAQSETLSNAEIIEMTRAGLSADVILKKIRTTNSSFDTSAAALVDLKKANVADVVINEMLDRQGLIPPNANPDNTPAFSESGSTPNTFAAVAAPARTNREIAAAAKTIAFGKSSAHPSRQALEKELMKRPAFRELGLTITRYKDSADLYVEIGRVPLSWLTHRYVYRIYDRRSGAVLSAGETTSWGSLAGNLAGHIARDLSLLKR